MSPEAPVSGKKIVTVTTITTTTTTSAGSDETVVVREVKEVTTVVEDDPEPTTASASTSQTPAASAQPPSVPELQPQNFYVTERNLQRIHGSYHRRGDCPGLRARSSPLVSRPLSALSGFNACKICIAQQWTVRP
jgi:hypothetical protein